MTAALRAAIQRLRGPRPNLSAAAAAAAAQPAEERATLTPARHLSDKFEPLKEPTVGKRRFLSRYSRRPARMKKTDDPGLKAIPWILGTFFILAFLERFDLRGEDDRQRTRKE